MNPLIVFHCGGEQAALAARQCLVGQGLQVVRSFDLTGMDSGACGCPHHGTPRCTCQYSVLLVYPDAGPPAVVTAHGREGRTQLEIHIDPNAPPDAGLVNRIRAALLEASGPAASLPRHTIPRAGAQSA
jgi:hypothetical protein